MEHLFWLAVLFGGCYEQGKSNACWNYIAMDSFNSTNNNQGYIMNKAPYTLFNLSLLALILLFTCEARADIYIKIGSGYKFIETDHIVMDSGERIYYDTGSKISARIEIGAEHGNWTYGVSHHSQWFDGYPFNDKKEYNKTEFFIDYKWTL